MLCEVIDRCHRVAGRAVGICRCRLSNRSVGNCTQLPASKTRKMGSHTLQSNSIIACQHPSTPPTHFLSKISRMRSTAAFRGGRQHSTQVSCSATASSSTQQCVKFRPCIDIHQVCLHTCWQQHEYALATVQWGQPNSGTKSLLLLRAASAACTFAGPGEADCWFHPQGPSSSRQWVSVVEKRCRRTCSWRQRTFVSPTLCQPTAVSTVTRCLQGQQQQQQQ